jgi:hypothetical protein
MELVKKALDIGASQVKMGLDRRFSWVRQAANIVALLIGNTSYKGNTEGHLEHFSGNVAVGLLY